MPPATSQYTRARMPRHPYGIAASMRHGAHGIACSKCSCGWISFIAGKFRLAEGVVGTVQNNTAQATGLLPASQAQYKKLAAESAGLKSQNAALIASSAETQQLVNAIVAQVNALTPVSPQKPHDRQDTWYELVTSLQEKLAI